MVKRLSVVCVMALLVAAPQAQTRSGPRITTPKEQFGRNIGDDYFLVNWTQWVEYLQKMDRESDRMSVVAIGKTAEGRTQYTAIITSPANHRRLAQFKDMNRRLALADGLTDEQARQLARDGKVVVWIDGGLHANEVLGAAQLIELTYRLNSATDPETLRILDDDIVLLTNINPDGMELVSNWYMRESDERRRSTAGVPRLYQKYIGHDNNRDFYMMNQPESENANRLMYREWFPAIMYNHHQTGPAGAVLFAPPFRDPFNYHFDPLIPLGIDIVGAAMHARLAVEGKPGAVMRSAAPYSTWFNGGIRTTSYFHNQIGILTEMIGNPTPTQIPFVPEMQLRRSDVPNPIAPQPWRFRQSIEYSMTTNYAILDIASERKEDFLFNMYRMAKNAIDAGSRDHWTFYPKRIDAVRSAIAKENGSGRGAAPLSFYDNVLRDPAARDPRGFILPADQPDFLTATKFVNILIRAGVAVHRATDPFTAAGKRYPAGSYVVKTAQPYRAHVMDMFEPQDHPNDFPYPGGPPRAPYDVTGYNPSYSMGIVFDRILDGFDGPFEKVPDVVRPSPGHVAAVPQGGAHVISGHLNDGFVAINRLLQAKQAVSRATVAFTAGARSYPAGSIIVAPHPTATDILQKVAVEKGVPVEAVAKAPSGTGATARLRPLRIGLWDTYGGSMPSGWTRWLLEQFEFPFQVVFPKTLDEGNLAEQVRCADLRRRRDPDARRRRQPAPPGNDPGGVPRLARQRQRRAYGSGAQEIRRGRRPFAGDWLIDCGGLSLRSADPQRARRARRWRRVGAASVREVLHPRFARRGAGRYRSSARLRGQRSREPVLRRQPLVSAAARGAGAGRRARRLVRVGLGAQERVGLGTASSRSDRSDRRRRAREGARDSVRAGDRLARPTARHVQVPVQRDSPARVTQCGTGRFKKLFELVQLRNKSRERARFRNSLSHQFV